MPDVTQVPVYLVSQIVFSQDFIDLVTEVFFGDSPVYDWDFYYLTMKTEALEKLNELKEYQAEGNTDPYGYIEAARENDVFEDGAVSEDDVYNLQEEIDEWEQAYAEAPETVEKTEVIPGFGVSSYEDENGNTVYYDDYFNGFVETEDGLFSYILKNASPAPMSIKISSYTDKEELSENVSWNETYYDSEAYASNAYRPTQEKCEELAGITAEEAIAGADSRSGTLVPVWDFFGDEEVHSSYDGVEYTNYIDYPGNSFLTINAADSTIIDRSLGY